MKHFARRAAFSKIIESCVEEKWCRNKLLTNAASPIFVCAIHSNTSAITTSTSQPSWRKFSIVPGWTRLPAWAQGPGRNFGLFTVTQASSSFGDIVLTEVRPVTQRQPIVPIEAKSVAAIFRTSGTTGSAKRVPVTHENLIEMARKMEEWLGLSPADRSACILPIYYNAGFKATLLVPLLIGCSVAMPTTTNPLEFDQWLADLFGQNMAQVDRQPARYI